jgi:hypothetical protein
MPKNKTPIDDSSMMPEVPPAAMPDPILDQLEISIWKGNHQTGIILSTFSEHFGKPEKTNDGKAWRWKKLGISMAAYEKWFWQVIRFPATQSAFDALTPVLNLFPKMKKDGKPAMLLRSAEIAWDFPINHVCEEPEEQLQKIVAITIPANKKASLRSKSSDSLYPCSDGAVNGLNTFYFQSLSLYPDNEDTASQNGEGDTPEADDENIHFCWLPSKTAVWRGKAYCKKLAPKTPWCIRFEVTLLGQKLEKVIGKIPPYDLTLLPRRLAGLCFDDFWVFERFDWSLFMESARRSAESKRISIADIEKRAEDLYPFTRLHGLNVTMWQKREARKIADLIGTEKLKTKIGAKKFSTILKTEDVLPKNLPEK